MSEIKLYPFLAKNNGVVVFLLLNNPGITSATKGTRILKFSTLMGLIAIYAGTIK